MLFEVPAAHVDDTIARAREVMEGAAHPAVHLEVQQAAQLVVRLVVRRVPVLRRVPVQLQAQRQVWLLAQLASQRLRLQ